MPLVPAALLLAVLALPSRAAAPLPPFDPYAPQGSWQKVSRADDSDMTGSLCPSTRYGVVEAVRLRNAPVTVFCMEPNGSSVRLRDSGFLLGPGAPALYVKDFKPELVSYPARLEAFPGPVAPASLKDCAERLAPDIDSTDRGCRRAVLARRIGEAIRAAARVGNGSSAVLPEGRSEQQDGEASIQNVSAGFGMDSVMFNNDFMVFFGEDEGILAYVIGHEYGHFWQKRRGALNPNPGDLARQRKVEAEADMYSFRILRDAGYPLARAVSGQQRFFAALPDRGGVTHPLHVDRVQAASVEALAPDRPQGLGPRGPQPRLTQGHMDRDGRPITLPTSVPLSGD